MATTNSLSQESFNVAPQGLYGVFYEKAPFQKMLVAVQGENEGGKFHFMSPQKFQDDLQFVSFESARWVGRLKISEAGEYYFSTSDIHRSCMKIWQNVTFDIQRDVLELMKCTKDGDQKIYTIPEKKDPGAKDAFRVKCNQGKCQILNQENEDENWDVEIRVNANTELSTTCNGTISYLLQQGDMTCYLQEGIYKIRVEYMPLLPKAENENIFTLYWQTPTMLNDKKEHPSTAIPAENLRGPDFSDPDYFPMHITDNLFDSEKYMCLKQTEKELFAPKNQETEAPTNVSYILSADAELIDEPSTSAEEYKNLKTSLDQLDILTRVQRRIKQIGEEQDIKEKQIKRWAEARKDKNIAYNIKTLIETYWKEHAPEFIAQLNDFLSILKNQPPKDLISTLQDLIRNISPQTNTFNLTLLQTFITKLDDFSKEESTLMKSSLRLSDAVSYLKTTLKHMKQLHSSQTSLPEMAINKWKAEYIYNTDPEKNLDPEYDVNNPHAQNADQNNDGISNYNSTHGFTVTPDGQKQPYGMRKDLPTYYCHYRLKSTTGDPFTDMDKLIPTGTVKPVMNISDVARNPLVAAVPYINMKMIGFQLIPDTTETKGYSHEYSFSVSNSRSSSQTNNTGVSTGTETAIHAEISLSETPSVSGGASKSWSEGVTNENSTSNSTEVHNTTGNDESHTLQQTYNTAHKANFSGWVTYQNSGTAAVSKLSPTFNFNYHNGEGMVPLVTVKPPDNGGAVVELLSPDASYPASNQDTPLVIKSTDAFNGNVITVSKEQVDDILSGRPMSLSLLQYDGYLPNEEISTKNKWVQYMDNIKHNTAHLTLITPEGDQYDRYIAAPTKDEVGYKGIDPKEESQLPFTYKEIDKAHCLTIGEAITLAFSEDPYSQSKDPSQKFVKKNSTGIKYDLQSKNVQITTSRETKDALMAQQNYAKQEVTETKVHLEQLDQAEQNENQMVNNKFRKLEIDGTPSREIQMADDDIKTWVYNFQQRTPIQKELETLEQAKKFTTDQRKLIQKNTKNAEVVQKVERQRQEIENEIDKQTVEAWKYTQKMDDILQRVGKSLTSDELKKWTENITTAIATREDELERIQQQRIKGKAYLAKMQKTLEQKKLYDYELRQGMRLIINIPPIVTPTFVDATTAEKHKYQVLYLKNHYLDQKLNYQIKLLPPSRQTTPIVKPDLHSFTPSQEKGVFGYKEGTLEALNPNTDSPDNKGQDMGIPHLSNGDRIEVWIKKETETEYNLLISKTVGQIPGFRAEKPPVNTDNLKEAFTFETFKVDWLYPQACNGIELSIPSPDILKEFLSFTLEVTDPITRKTDSYGPVLASEIRKNIVSKKVLAKTICTIDFSLFKNFDMKKKYLGYTFKLNGKLDEAVSTGWDNKTLNYCKEDTPEKMKNCVITIPTFLEPRTISIWEKTFPGKTFSLQQYMNAFQNKGDLSNPETNVPSEINAEYIRFNSVYPEFVLERQGDLLNQPLLLTGIKNVTCSFKNKEKTEVITPDTPDKTQFTMRDNALHVRFHTTIDKEIKTPPSTGEVSRGLGKLLVGDLKGGEGDLSNKYHTCNAAVNGLIKSENLDKNITIQITVDKDILTDNNQEDQTFTIFNKNI